MKWSLGKGDGADSGICKNTAVKGYGAAVGGKVQGLA